jgi:hypothetical protein
MSLLGGWFAARALGQANCERHGGYAYRLPPAGLRS